jgi:16S rRNA (guanine527-N7)-methyltransferase
MSKGAEILDFTLSDFQLDQYQEYYDLLIFWNKSINLTTLVGEKEVAEKHFLDSLAYVKGFPKDRYDLQILDIGSGAGFPGVPLKILIPQLKMTLIEPSYKRTSFLHLLNSKLRLDLRIIESRGEEWLATCRDAFDVIVMRAVGELDHFIEHFSDRLASGGRFIVSRGPSPIAFRNRTGRRVEKITLTLPNTEIERILLVIQ